MILINVDICLSVLTLIVRTISETDSIQDIGH